MLVFRLASRKYEPTASEGANRYGGCWNPNGECKFKKPLVAPAEVTA
jgi:RES domain-containing protein